MIKYYDDKKDQYQSHEMLIDIDEDLNSNGIDITIRVYGESKEEVFNNLMSAIDKAQEFLNNQKKIRLNDIKEMEKYD